MFNIKNIILVIFISVITVIILLCLALRGFIDRPSASYLDYKKINTYNDPQQISVQEKPIVLHSGKNPIYLTPIASYKIGARVLSKCNYWFGWDGEIVPIDLALGWGDVARKDLATDVVFFQFNRFYYYVYGSKCPMDGSYIASHSANNHLIPASRNIQNALNTLKNDDIIEIDGYLISMTANINGNDFFWKSSTTRLDTGGGACELILVKSLKIGDFIYK